MNKEKITRAIKSPTQLKIYDMIKDAYPRLDKFPRHERGYQGMTTKIKGIMAVMADCCIATQKCYYKKSVLKQLNELDLNLQKCKFWVRLSYDLGYINFKGYEIINNNLVEIGKLIGGWIKAVNSSEDLK